MNISEQRNQPNDDSKASPSKRPRPRKKADQGRRRDCGGGGPDAPGATGQAEGAWWLKLGKRHDRQVQAEIRHQIQEIKRAALSAPQAKIERVACIYMIANIVNGRAYIGITTDLRRRVAHHKTTLRCNRHICKPLLSEWHLFGESAFRFFPILPDLKSVRFSHHLAEKQAIAVHDEDECYNKIAARGRTHNNRGERLKSRVLKMTESEWNAFGELGGLDWLRKLIERAKPPK